MDDIFSFAAAPEVVRSNQKDSLIELQLKSQFRELLHWLRGVRFVHTHADKIDSLAKSTYLALTTLNGSRTLGEEYVDLFYMTPWHTLPSKSRKVAYVLFSSLGPLFGQRLLRNQWVKRVENLNLLIFYFVGSYYQLSKRLFGLRYALGHRRSMFDQHGSYQFLGVLMALRLLVSLVNKVSADASDLDVSSSDSPAAPEVSLEDPEVMPWIPEQSRVCNLCLEPIKSPATTLCGHLFCWTCASEWCRERPECPLCRQKCLEQQLLPLRY